VQEPRACEFNEVRVSGIHRDPQQSSQFRPISSACPYRDKTFVLIALLNRRLVSLLTASRSAAGEMHGSVTIK
jgi:hypothetical protein